MFYILTAGPRHFTIRFNCFGNGTRSQNAVKDPQENQIAARLKNHWYIQFPTQMDDRKITDLWKGSQNKITFKYQRKQFLLKCISCKKEGKTWKLLFKIFLNMFLESIASIKQWFTFQITRVEKPIKLQQRIRMV